MQTHILSFHNTQLHHGVLHSMQKSLSFKHHQNFSGTRSSVLKRQYTCTERKATVTTSCLDDREVLETRRIWGAMFGKAPLSTNDFTFF